jgi:hypothetical protein
MVLQTIDELGDLYPLTSFLVVPDLANTGGHAGNLSSTRAENSQTRNHTMMAENSTGPARLIARVLNIFKKIFA